MKPSGCLVLIAVLSTGLKLNLHADPIISEFLADNNSILADQDGAYSDWIEIHNPDASPINLDGWYLTDNDGNLTRWRFPSTNLPSGGFLVVFASGKNRSVSGSQLHTSFSLNAGGEFLALVKSDGTTPASAFSPAYPEQFPNISYGWSPAASRNQYFQTPTPGSANGPGFDAYVAEVRFSQERGFFGAPFNVTLSTATAGASIRYTTNGTPPSATNGLTYIAPIPISRTTTLRAAGFRTGYQPSRVETHTYIFVADVVQQSPTGAAPPGWPASWGANVVNYGMDPNVVNDPAYSGTIQDDLKTLPSFSVVMDLRDLFNPSAGIYANPGQDGRAWERPCSLELIQPDGSEGFQINAGIRIRGGFSRSTDNPKHALRFFFRSEYGAGKLVFPLFGDQGTDTFDNLDLRTFQNYSWSFQGDNRGVFMRDQMSRDLQLAMGHQGERGTYCHLYINGQYWGLFNTCERPEASFAATYFGGEPEDYDVVKVEAGPYTINATDGTMAAWTRLYNQAKAGLSTDAAYQRLQGNNPDGTRNPAYEVLLDVDNLIDYMLVILYGGNLDAPISNFLGNTRPNNWYGFRNRVSGLEGFRFVAHDSEHTLLNANENRTGPYPAGSDSVVYSSPQYLWQQLAANAEFRMRVADQVHRHCFNSGVLTPQAVLKQYLTRSNELNRAVVGESARWGDSKREPAYTRATWISAVNGIANNFIPQRTAVLLNQLRAKGLYPTVVAPAFNQHGGVVSGGFPLSITAPAGTIYYTRDGSDPRLPGGAVAPAALPYTSPFGLAESAQIHARALVGTNWSALNSASFYIEQDFTELLITEIMYHPAPEGDVDGEEFEFIELKNVSAASLELSGVCFTNGIRFVFPIGTFLAPGEFAVLVGNPEAFSSRYPGVPVAGRYSGRLSNNGETLTLAHATGAVIASLAYGDRSPWPSTADGDGFSLVPVNPNFNPDPKDAVNWRASTRIGGSPGADDPPSSIAPVWVNEVLTHTDPPAMDAVELYNPNSISVDISHWYLTDRRGEPKKFRIPAGTSIPPGGYRVFDESDFNSPPGGADRFLFDSHGEQVYLYSADSGGNLTGYSDGFSFGAAANGVSFGRLVTSAGEIQYPPQIHTTLGTTNSGPRVGPVVINEIRYHPAFGDEEFVELMNITGTAVALYDPEFPTNTWRLGGVGFSFPTGAEIAANGVLLVVGSDPAAFRTRNQVPPNVPIFGPFPGVLQDDGELLSLQRPDAPDLDTNNGSYFVPYIDVDAVRYNDKAPWPVAAAGTGPSLERIETASYGNDPINWRASPGPASPGLDNNGNRLPLVNAGGDRNLESASFPLSLVLNGSAVDDGLPDPPGALTFRWTQVAGPAGVVFDNPSASNTTARFPGLGTYVLRLTADDGEFSAFSESAITLSRLAAPVTLVPRGSVWKYLDTGANMGVAWRSPLFDDATWASGPAELGYGDGDEATVISYGPNPSVRYITTYFRRSFVVPDASSVTALTVGLVRDDGAVVFLNGTEVFRSNMPESGIGYTTRASNVVGGGDESAVFTQTASPSLLVNGTNVLAVEVHQSGPDSTDVSFDLELSGLALPPNQPPGVNAGPDQSVTLPASAALAGTVTDDGLPIQPGLVSVAWSNVSGPGTVSFADAAALQTTASFSALGTYGLRLSASDGALTSHDDIEITVDGQGEPILAFDAILTNGDPMTSVVLRFTALAGRTYTVQRRDSLTSGDWVKLANVPDTGTDRTVDVADPETAGSTTRYYRIVTPAL